MYSEMISKSKVSKGNLTVVPKYIRRSLGVHEGDYLEWSLEGDRAVFARYQALRRAEREYV